MSLIASAAFLAAAASPSFAGADCAALAQTASLRDWPAAREAMTQLAKAGPDCLEAALSAAAVKPRVKARMITVATEVGDAGVPKLLELQGRAELTVQAGEALLAAVTVKSDGRIPALLACAGQAAPAAAVCARALVQASSPKAARHAGALTQALKSKDAGLRAAAALALARLGAKGASAKPALIAALGDEDAPVRSAAARALGGLRGQAKDAVPALQSLSQDHDSDVRREAEQALKSING